MSITDAAGYGFSAYAVPTALTAVLMLGFGASVLARRVSSVSLTLFSVTLAAAVWKIAFTFMYCSREPDTALFWARLAYVGVPFIAPGLYHFCPGDFALRRLERTATHRMPLPRSIVSLPRVF